MVRGMKEYRKKGFTLIELLVVIAVITLMLAVLMPALKKAKFIAGRVVCMANIKDQYLSQILYAEDNDGKFAPHNEFIPHSARTKTSSLTTSLFDAMKPYVNDPDIMTCPLLRKFGHYYT